jgi:hypothetical protein
VTSALTAAMTTAMTTAMTRVSPAVEEEAALSPSTRLQVGDRDQFFRSVGARMGIGYGR